MNIVYIILASGLHNLLINMQEAEDMFVPKIA